ncbi:uncharacterized protein LOC9651935 isoform X1 [Selaginella moellendorffii]|uniref:uncharacterized protein LOC9651935 isoform X1 n=1 Tax=Selaginella moellendorffii TaxID=88036 RepID=UPI000D1C8D89|nr:uncharacterized protein LOC9651935 isoform X1 [Selaginella moellendorffii]|eukprot:XP_024517379.1 uncharacterized protein LOC9651935 isoform X1 [Selaginella moellendorffii]
MAVQAGMATSKLIILLGAGMTGSILIKNGKLSDFFKDLSKVFSKHLKEDDKDEVTETLAQQVQRLTNDLRQLAGSRNITVVNAPGTSGQSSNLSSLAMPALVIGVAGYGYFWWKGWSWTDVMYVTRRNMSNVVASVSKQLDQVSAAVTATKRHLTSRIDSVSKTLDDSVAVQGLIKNEVFEIRGDVARVGGDIGAVQQIVEGLGNQLDDVQTKQDFTNQGIILLCQFARRWEETRRQELPGISPILSLQNGEAKPASGVDSILQGLPPLPKARLERSASATGSGLKELQFISDALSGNSGDSSKLQRTLTPNLSFRLQKT